MTRQSRSSSSPARGRPHRWILNAGCIAAFGFALTTPSTAQTPGESARNTPAEAVGWVVSTSPGSEVKRGGRVSVELKGSVRDGWHIYGLERQSRGPLPMYVYVPKDAAAVSDGAVTGSEPTKAFDPAFGFDTQYYADSFTLTVPVQLNADLPPGEQVIPVNVQYQACDGKVCLLPKTIKLSARVNVR